jgi:hypothetical protein
MIIGVLVTFFSMIIGFEHDLIKTIKFNENIFFILFFFLLYLVFDII